MSQTDTGEPTRRVPRPRQPIRRQPSAADIAATDYVIRRLLQWRIGGSS